MSFGWAFLLYLLVGIVCRLILAVVVTIKSKADKQFKDESWQVFEDLNDLIDDRAQQTEDPKKFLVLLGLFGYIFWPLDLAGFVSFLFPPKE